MPQLAGPLVEHKFKKTTVVGGSYVFFPGKVQMPKHVHSRMLMEKEVARRRKEKEEQQMGMSAVEIAALETNEAGIEGEGTGGEGAGVEGEGVQGSEIDDEE